MDKSAFPRFRDHLVNDHGWREPWKWDSESFAEFMARIEEQHTERHLERDDCDHGHAWLMSERCGYCDSAGSLMVVGRNGVPLSVTCPECAGLAIAPAQ